MIICPHDFMVKLGLRPTHDEIAASWQGANRAFFRALRQRHVDFGGIVCGIPGAGKSTWARANDSDRVVLFDAVFSHRGQRESMARRVRHANRDAVAVFVRGDIEVAIERMARRSIGRRVPTGKIRAAAARLAAAPPTADRGWASVLEV